MKTLISALVIFTVVSAMELTPEVGTIQSWYKHPLKDLPEKQPYTFMYLAKEFIQANEKKED